MLLALAVLPIAVAAAPAPAPGSARLVTRSEILEAMRESQGYELTATANAGRLHAEVLLRLVEAAQARDPQGPPLFIDRGDWFSAYLERVGLPAERAPQFARLAYQNRQDTWVDYRRDRVIRERAVSPRPAVAANVWISWPPDPESPRSYSYEDQRASPRLRVTMLREMSYRLLLLDGIVLYGELRGLRGRPVSGPLGALFDLLGEVSVVESRMAVARDGTQVSRGLGRKLGLAIWATVTVQPDGRADKGVPSDRPDLEALEARLKRPVDLEWVPLPPPPTGRGDRSDAQNQ